MVLVGMARATSRARKRRAVLVISPQTDISIAPGEQRRTASAQVERVAPLLFLPFLCTLDRPPQPLSFFQPAIMVAAPPSSFQSIQVDTSSQVAYPDYTNSQPEGFDAYLARAQEVAALLAQDVAVVRPIPNCF